jgi:hypothetical protein
MRERGDALMAAKGAVAGFGKFSFDEAAAQGAGVEDRPSGRRAGRGRRT